jgi:hypothetical protein
MEAALRIEAIDRAKRWGVSVSACVLVGLAACAWLQVADADASVRHCAPVVSKTGPGFTKASVVIVTGRVDCQKSRKVIFEALSTASYKSKQINGWDCQSTGKGGSGVYGARCSTQGEKGEEVIKSTVPEHCGGCDNIRD